MNNKELIKEKIINNPLKYYSRKGETENPSLLFSNNDSEGLFLCIPDLEIKDFVSLYKRSKNMGMTIDDCSRELLKYNNSSFFIYSLDNNQLGPPIASKEVWAAGVTYSDSMKERQAESDTPDIYAKVYNAERPEIFFKATQDRIQGPFDQVGIRADSGWDVPEAELAIVIISGEIAGYTIGNDMSSRLIEGENPLYLPQAKIYEKSCSIGPCIVSPETVSDPQDLQVQLKIMRDGNQVFEGECSTSQMKRSCAEIADWIQRHNKLPDGTIVLTGTGIIPPQNFTLKQRDLITIEIEKIGKIINEVVLV